MGKFKEILIEENRDSLMRTFKSKDQLPVKVKQYLLNQGYYLKAEGLVLTEQREITSDYLHFIGHTTYYSNQLTYTIQSLETNKRMIIKTDTSYSFFEIQMNSFVEEEYF